MTLDTDKFLALYGVGAEADNTTDEFLQHFGVRGMHWGIRKATPTGASHKTNREAKKDADEYSKAKLFYGDGAGTRRKLIKATVEAKSKRDPEYKKAFDHHVQGQDLAKRASQARGERHRKDVVSGTTKHARSIHRLLTGGFGNATMAASVIVGAYGLAKASGYDKVIVSKSKTAYRDISRSPAAAAVKAVFIQKGWIK